MFKKLLLISIFAFTSPAYSMDIEDVEVGNTVYIKNLVSENEKCEVMDISTSDNTVYVRNSPEITSRFQVA